MNDINNQQDNDPAGGLPEDVGGPDFGGPGFGGPDFGGPGFGGPGFGGPGFGGPDAAHHGPHHGHHGGSEPHSAEHHDDFEHHSAEHHSAHDDDCPDDDSGHHHGPHGDFRPGFGRGFGPRGGGFGPGFGPGFRPGFGPRGGGSAPQDDDGDFGPHGDFGPRRGFGPGPGRGFGPGFGPGLGGFGPGFKGGFGRGGRVRKGNVRSAIFSLLSQHSYNGYSMIGAIATHTDGAWRPSPGSIYPALAALQAEGLIESTGKGKRTEFELTEAGRTYVSEHPEEMAAVWADVSEEAGAGTELRQSIGKLMGAVQQIGLAGTEEQVKATTETLDAARRTIYKLLAD